MTGALFLAGGGSPEQSFALDEAFVGHCRPSGPLIYIPTALRTQTPAASLAWFRATMARHDMQDIEMWSDLAPTLSSDRIGGVYIGGGDTLFLRQEMRRTGFDRFVLEALSSGAPIYGGSAGAIVFGTYLGTSQPVEAAGQGMTEGLGLVHGHSVACHFEKTKLTRLQGFSDASGTSVIAIPEAAGVVIEGAEMRNLGSEAITILNGEHATAVLPTQSISLTGSQ